MKDRARESTLLKTLKQENMGAGLSSRGSALGESPPGGQEGLLGPHDTQDDDFRKDRFHKMFDR